MTKRICTDQHISIAEWLMITIGLFGVLDMIVYGLMLMFK